MIYLLFVTKDTRIKLQIKNSMKKMKIRILRWHKCRVEVWSIISDIKNLDIM